MSVALEFERIARIGRILGPAAPSDVELAIGDDAAVLGPRASPTVWTIDASVEGVHFRRDWLSFEDIGYRATVAAASDVLAMGAVPTAALAAWTLPADIGEDDIDAIARGQRQAADALSMGIVGGNLADGSVLSITTTVMGVAERPARRSGAAADERVVLLGEVGAAALGVHALSCGGAASRRAPAAVSVWRRPPVHLAHAPALAGVATAMLDVSDGLAQDLGHLARASGVRVVIDAAALAALRRDVLSAEAVALGVDLLRFELAGGEDYALVGTVPAGVVLPDGVAVIGWTETGEGVEVIREGRREPAPAGHVHGQPAPAASREPA